VNDDIFKLTTAAARGDEAAIAAFYRRYFDLLYGHARQVSRRDESFCLDVVQEVMLRVVRTLRPIDCEARLAAWLRLVVKSVAYDLLRKERRRRAHEVARSSGAVCAPESEMGEDRLGWLRHELLALDPGLVRLIELRFARGWTLARIGALLGLSTGTIDGRLRRALETLRRSAETADV
jgi:RNA polymerase sigma factor (sigma-70 family)